MTEIADNNIFGFFMSSQSGEAEQESVKEYLWGANGLKEQLKSLKWPLYGNDMELVLFKIYVNPIPYLRNALKEMENYRPKEKSVGIIIILDHTFFNLTEEGRRKFFYSTILSRLEQLKVKAKRNKLDFDIEKLIADTDRLLLLN